VKAVGWIWWRRKKIKLWENAKLSGNEAAAPHYWYLIHTQSAESKTPLFFSNTNTNLQDVPT
jgi:hypothetical protein